jgi:sugar-specific transcriptional regulator TrmB
MVKEVLKTLGLTDNEVDVYLTLLSEGESTVNDIGYKGGLHRKVCYRALDKLLEKGLVSYIIRKNTKYFKAAAPERIIDYLKEKKKEVISILPQIRMTEEKKEIQVKLIRGRFVLRNIYNDIIKELKAKKDVMYAMGVEETKFLEFDKITIKQFIVRMKENKLKEKLLTKESATSFFEGSQSEYRMLPDKLFNPNPTHIYADKVAIIIWGTPTYGIVIKNKGFADANRTHFKMLWGIAKKRKNAK